MKAYLDTNIYIDLEQNNYSLKQVLNCVNSKIDEVYFSASHLQEAEEILGENQNEIDFRIKKRVQTLHKVTNSRYINEDLENNVWYKIEHPENVLETIRDVPGTNEIMKSFTNLISSEQKDEFRKSLGVDSAYLNNYSDKDVVNHLNVKLENWGLKQSFLEMIEHSISFHPQASSMGVSNRFAAIFEFLDMIGYWKDKETSKSNYARFWDSSHAFYAAHCDYFISNDKKTCMKTKVLYTIYQIPTKIVSSSGKEW
jgi:predicted nucleic acid-binding protein